MEEKTGYYPTDSAGNPIYHYDMCAYCSLDTAGQHEPDCPLAQPRIIGVPFGERKPKPNLQMIDGQLVRLDIGA